MVNLDFSSTSLTDALVILESKIELDWIEPYAEFLKAYIHQNEFIVQTSGTTGKKKDILVSKAQMQQSASGTIEYFKLRPSDSIFLSLSCNFIAGKMMLVRAIEGRLNLFISEPTSDPSDQINQVFDFTPLVPMQVKALLKSGKINLFKQVLIGGGKVEESTIKALNEKDITAFESFAMTETLTHFAIKEVSPNPSEYFTTIKGYTVKANINNELIVLDFNNHQIKTNDLIDLKTNTKFKWLGRTDNLINSGGVKLIPEEIESKISKQIPTPFVLIGMPDEKLGQKIVLVSETELTTTLEAINNSLPKFEKIKAKFQINKFPKTESGKIIRNKVLELIHE